MNIRRGLLAGVALGMVGLVGPPAGIALFAIASWWLRGTREFDIRYEFYWLLDRAFPGVVVVPMLLFFTGLSTYTPQKHGRFAKTLAILACASLPIAALLGSLGMAHPRYKVSEHPPIYLSEVAMFFLPVFAVSCMLIWWRNRSETDR